jgi:Spy/CpxP family protein refolding chaperone
MKYVVTLLTVVLISAVARSQAPPAPLPTPVRVGRLGNLGLTEEQNRRVAELRRNTGQRMRELEQTLAERRRDLEGMYRTYSLDALRARQWNTQINTTQREILEQHLKLQQELRKILTSDQFDRLRERMERRPPGERFQRPKH